MTDKNVKDVVADLAQMEYEGNLRAVGYIAVLGNGDMRVNFCAPEGTKTALFSASAIQYRNLLECFTAGGSDK